MKTLLEKTLTYLPNELYAKIILDNLDKKAKKALIKNVKNAMTKGELHKLEQIKSQKQVVKNYETKESIVATK